MLDRAPMSSSEFIYKKMASLEHSGVGRLHETACKFDAARQMPPAIRHELNNILTIIQGYADGLLRKHRHDPTLQPPLQLILESAKRATTIIREAAPPAQDLTPPQNLSLPQIPH
jgi:signal transduction histidine kinase